MKKMTETKEQRLAREIYENVGGMGNVEKIIHCMTRVRLTIADYSKVNIEGLKAVDGVLGVVEDETLQVVLGPGIVNKVANLMVHEAGVKLGENFPKSAGHKDAGRSNREMAEAKAAEVKAREKAKHKSNGFKRALKSISNIFVPLIPAFVGAGIIGGVAAIFQNMMTAGHLSQDWATIITTLNIIKNGLYLYLVIYVGINSANEFGATPGLGGVIGAVTMLTGMDPKNPLPNIFTGDALSPL